MRGRGTVLKKGGIKKMKVVIFRRNIKPNRGMRLRMGVAWSMVSMIQEPMQGMEGAAEGTQCHCRTCVRRPFWGHCGILLEAWADEKDEVQVIEDAFELHASMRARPEMNYYYY